MAGWSTSNAGSGDEMPLLGYFSRTSNETVVQTQATDDCVFSNIRARVTAGNSGTATFKFRDAGADGAQSCTLTGAGDTEDATNSDTLTGGDLYNLSYTDTGTDSTLSWVAGNVAFSSGYGAYVGAVNYSGVVCDVESATRFFPINGFVAADGEATEANVGFKARGYTTFQALQVYISANARTNNSVFTNRINSGAGTGSITFATTETGLKVVTGLGDAITDGQIINAALTLDTGVEDLTLIGIYATLKSTDTEQDVWSQHVTGFARAASATANYHQISGLATTTGAWTDAQARMKPGYAGTAKNLRCYLSANTYGGDATLKLMQNGSAVITTTLTAGGGAAWYENTSDSITFDDNDELSFEIDEGTSGSATVRMIGITLAPAVGGARRLVGPQFSMAGIGGLAA